eukprot:m.330940 g.330940  ORF g.330940 m.330940 type:complete len:114 (-) comp16612_c0_seq1:55-396(-)
MRYVAAYLLASLGSDKAPSKDGVKKILDAAGVSVEDDKLDKVMDSLKGKDLATVIAEGSEKLASVPSGGGGGGGGGGAAPAAGGDAGGAPAEEKKEEAKEESEEEDMGFGLFD